MYFEGLGFHFIARLLGVSQECYELDKEIWQAIRKNTQSRSLNDNVLG
jgi:hypothetical protein